VKNKPKSEKLRIKIIYQYQKHHHHSLLSVFQRVQWLVYEMAQAFSPMGIVLDFTPVNAPSSNTTQAFPPVITTLDFTPVQPKPPVPMQAFSLVVDVQDVTPAQSKPPDSKNQSRGRSTTHECHNWVCSPSHRSNASSCPACGCDGWRRRGEHELTDVLTKMNFSHFGHVINPSVQLVSHASQGPLMKWNLAAWRKGGLSHLPTCGYYWVLSDEILLLSQVDEMEFLSGVSQSHMGDELIKIVQYCWSRIC